MYRLSMSNDRTSISLPTDLADYAKAKGAGNTSSYIADLIERDRQRDALHAMFQTHGYAGAKAITETGTAAMGDRLRTLRAQRAGRSAA
jgi:hypothetical protein